MPTYIYQLNPEKTGDSKGCEICREGFETVQRMSENPLEACPECQAPIHRVIQPVGINTSIIDGKISDKKLENLGFTKIVKDDDGKYKKLFGNDPASDILDQKK